MKLRNFSLTALCMSLGRIADFFGVIIGLKRYPIFIISVCIGVCLYLFLYFNLCGIMLLKDLFGYERQHFICLRFSGRLGNIMFQYAFLYALAKKKNLQMVIPDKLELMDSFYIKPNKLESFGFSKNLCWCFWRTSDYWDCAHDEHIEALPPGKDYSFDGYFQSWMYWQGFEEEIRKQFEFRNFLKIAAHNELRYIFSQRKINYSDGTVIIGIHIRRGDYFKKNFANYGYKIADEKYLKNAMQYFKDKYKKVLFVACSNDYTWTTNTLSKYEDVHVVGGNSPALDMAILTQTNHTIMTVGTFGWWIAFLTNGTTIYYKYPFVEGTGFSKQFKTLNQHFYPGWIPME